MFSKSIRYVAFSLALAVAPQVLNAHETQPLAAYQMPQVTKSLLTDIIQTKADSLVAIGVRGHILLSQDGTKWTQAQVPVQSNLNSVYFISKDKGWAVGHDATILVTQDAGLTWQIQQYAPETDKPLFDIFFYDENKGIAVGAYGMYYQTEDGGKTWETRFHESLLLEEDREYLSELKETDPESYEMEAESLLPHFNRLYADDKALYMIGEAGFAAKSTDFGESWVRLEPFYNGSLFDISRISDTQIVAVGLRGNAFISDDEGLNWQQISLSKQATLNSVFSDENGTVYFVGNSGTLLSSQDATTTFIDHSLADGKAIINGLVWRNKLLLVSEVGIKSINLSELK